MSQDLLAYYSQELFFIRRMGAEFAQRHAPAAARLRIGEDGISQDPHVERMVEAFAYLTARIRRKLDDDFTQVSEALLQLLYPHYLAPTPSAAIVQLHLDRGQGDLFGGYHVRRGAAIDSDMIDGETCSFRTCYDTTLWPVEVERAALGPLPASTPAEVIARGATACLSVRLKCFSAEGTLAKMKMPALRFFLRGNSQHTQALYELLMQETREISLSNAPQGKEMRLLGREAISPVGFDREQAILPQDARTFPGYRLLSEFFAMPEKFLFVEIGGLNGETLASLGNSVDLNIYLAKSTGELEHNVSAATLCLGCTPMVNLFFKRSEPIELNGTQAEYRIVPDERHAQAHEIFSVDRVMGSTQGGHIAEYHPLYSHRHGEKGEAFWFTTRKTAEESGAELAMSDQGTEVFLSLVDLHHEPANRDQLKLDVELTCMNRDLPHRLPYGPGEPRLHLAEGGAVKIECLTQPTPTLRPALGSGMLWRLVSHLSLNHLSISGDQDAAEALREILNLYNPADSGEWAGKIAGILSVKTSRATGRLADMPGGGFCRGVHVQMQLDEAKFPDNGLYLFASVLERFLALYASVNSFSQLSVSTTRREREPMRWRPRAAERVLL